MTQPDPNGETARRGYGTAVWIAILCGGTALSVTLGIRQSLGLYLIPITVDLAVGREVFSLAIGLMNLVWGVAAPFAGAIADRHGAGRVVAIGGVCYGLGLALMTLSGDGGQLILAGLLLGLGLSGAGFTVILGAVGRAAPPEKQSAALGLVSVGGSIGQFLALPFVQGLIDGVGWWSSLLILAVLAAVMVPLARGIATARPSTPVIGGQNARAALREATGHRGYWLLTAGFFVCGFHLAFVGVHLPAYLTDQGLPAWLGATALAVVGFCNIIGTYGCGLLGARYRRKSVLSLLYLARALIFLLFLATPATEVTVLIFASALGFLWLGTVPLTSGLVAYIFGPAHMSMLFGIVFMSHQFGGFLGAWLAGRVYDSLGSYDVMWWLNVALGLLSAALHWPIVERPVPRLAGSPV